MGQDTLIEFGVEMYCVRPAHHRLSADEKYVSELMKLGTYNGGDSKSITASSIAVAEHNQVFLA